MMYGMFTDFSGFVFALSVFLFGGYLGDMPSKKVDVIDVMCIDDAIPPDKPLVKFAMISEQLI